MESILLGMLASFTALPLEKILDRIKENYGKEQEDLQRSEGETLSILSNLQTQSMVLEKAYDIWLDGDVNGSITILKNSGLYEEIPSSNPNLIEWFKKHVPDVRSKILGAVRTFRALEKEIEMELYSLKIELSYTPKVTLTYQKRSE